MLKIFWYSLAELSATLDMHDSCILLPLATRNHFIPPTNYKAATRMTEKMNKDLAKRATKDWSEKKDKLFQYFVALTVFKNVLIKVG